MADNFYASYPVTSGGGGSGVSSLNSLTGALTLVAGTGISVTPSGSNITIASTSAGDLTLTAFGSTPNANGASLSGQALTLQPADATHPGGVSTTTQTFGGSKTFSSLMNADGGIDRSTSGTLTIGATNATTINIGNAGATVNIQGSTIYENTPILQTSDPLITINHGGGAGSGQNAGIQVEEASSITGYAETSSDRNSWIFKAPNTAGIVTMTPGASGFTIDQASHNPLTLAAVGSSPNANGASLSTQVLTLQPADGTNPGVLTAGTQTIGGAKTFSTAVTITPTASLVLGQGSTAHGQILLKNDTNNNNLTIQSGTTSPNWTLTLPVNNGTANTFLHNPAGDGVATWSNVNLATSDVTGVLPVANGGTGLSTQQVFTVTTSIKGNGSVIATGVVPGADIRIPNNMTITGWYLEADQSGSIVIDIWKTPFASLPATVANTITASALPTLSSQLTNSNTTLTGWTTSVTAGDYLRFNVNSVTTCTYVVLNITMVRA